MGLIIPGLTLDPLGEIYEYYPTFSQLRVAAGVFAVGFLVFTLMLKVAVPISLGEFIGGPLSAREEPCRGVGSPARSNKVGSRTGRRPLLRKAGWFTLIVIAVALAYCVVLFAVCALIS